LVFIKLGMKHMIDEDFDVFIEDNLEQAKQIADVGINSFLLDKPWNQGELNNTKCKRCNNWDTILKEIDSLS